MKIAGIIPVRYNSVRLQGKALRSIRGVSVIERVYNQVSKAGWLDDVIIATDDVRISNHARSFGAEAVLTGEHHTNGTERCAEVVKGMDVDYVVNIQGDEAFIDAELIGSVAGLAGKELQIGTAFSKIEDPGELFNSNVVKVVPDDAQKRAMYFSRHCIPFLRDKRPEEWHLHHTYYKHIGIYFYPRNVLLEIAKRPPAVVEMAERLEQLRWLEHGFRIDLVECSGHHQGVDSIEDIGSADALPIRKDNAQ